MNDVQADIILGGVTGLATLIAYWIGKRVGNRVYARRGRKIRHRSD